MKNNNWEQAFGCVPENFERKVRTTVAKMEAQPARVYKPRASFVFAMVLILLVGTAFALSRLGVLDTLNDNLQKYVQPQASELVQQNLQYTAEQPRHATFTVEEAVNDGHQIYVTLRVHGNEDVLLMDEEASASWSREWWQHPWDTDTGETFSDAADSTNRQLIQAIAEPVSKDGERLNSSTPTTHYDGGDILYNITYPSNAEGAYLKLYTYEVYGDDSANAQRISTGKIDCIVPMTDTRRIYTANTPFELAIGNITITELNVEQTPIATYLTYAYEPSANATDLERVNMRSGVLVSWLDEKGEMYREGSGSQLIDSSQGEGGRVITPYRAFEQMPQSITLQFYGGSYNGEIDTITVPIREVEKEKQKQ